ncbi:hypothetical protein [Thermomonas carbonis]|uniref:Lipoprotein n=1 Tax=Thermomonas carbonis TaxID=1463158 RepID=A0A7G9SR13_9GAMM|nr:hypothetical protein [Thermomonas carbonis]QNN70288.1 hypothetical protein H9L16_01180 [Thermomonas carbonis]GHB99024.1 hypothetical protein GCM10010080_09570 [Thermomonas carbonis]
MRRVLLTASVAMLVTACSPAPAPAPTPPAAKPAPVTTPAAEAPAPVEAETAAPIVETWELPGDLNPLTTQAQLEARFGKTNLREETFNGAEGMGTYPVLVAFPDDPAKRLELMLDADNKDAPIQELRVTNAESLWHDATGLRPGMSLAELVALNGAPVSFYGLAWDYGGTVQDWHGGKLANAVGNPLFRRVTLTARTGADDNALPQGDATFRSDDPKWASAGKDMVVGELGISWPHDGED